MTESKNGADRISERTPTHAGAVTFRQSTDRTFYLIVSSSNGSHWVSPKGHIEPGETSAAAALRELKEEAGVSGEILDCLSMQYFKKADEEVVVQYFLVRELSSTQASERRTLRWEELEAALQLLTFDEARNALREAAAALGRLENPK